MATEERQRISWNFKRLREKHSWTQEEAASKIDALTNYIAQIEGSQCSFGAAARKKWAEIFNVDIAEFYRPIAQTERDRIIDAIRLELLNLDIEKLIRFKELIPILFGGQNVQERERTAISPEKKTA